ncbi:dTDP-4-dehydrorhamnose reductase [Aeromonas enteropelogenes]|uniref:dTDP-4-dehydrorhamnose reductase n=1 Tax=Aeromonas enteropelogenes TaxID=29489 RepID=UPI000F52E313|nr:dTDP-4-dehydrorhamnose reductase [Aeromonas enteropelogenes]RQM69676.1 dTDP-4-dehydrorhamnose reductase [Aeromonas enteropelogenes]
MRPLNLFFYGASGQLGQGFEKIFTSRHQRYKVTPIRAVLAETSIVQASHRTPAVILNAAAYTDVAGAELAPAQAMRVNGEGVARLAELAKQHNALLVHFSTDYVFDGTGNHPWRESDKPAPLNVYGQSKWAGEQAIIASGCRYLIIRTSWLHSPWRTNFLKTMLQLAHSRDELQVVCDQIGAPTSASVLAEVTLQAIESTLAAPELEGLYHVTAAGAVSWFDYACFLLKKARAMGLIERVPRVIPIVSHDYPSHVLRPLNSRLDTQLFQQTFGVRLPDWQQGVSVTLQALLEERP